MNTETTFPSSSEDSDDPKAGPRRKNRGIRFSDPEWEQIEREAKKREISPSELVRIAAVAMATGEFPMGFDGRGSTLPPGISNQIEKIYRGVYVLATLKRDEMHREGRQKELENIHEEARKTQKAIRNSSSG